MRRQQTLDGKELSESPKPPKPYILSELEQCLPLVEEQGYKKTKIPKTRGKWRELCVPSPDLKKTQRRILKLLTRNTNVPRWSTVFGLYKRGYPHIEHARIHSNSRFILTLDVENAFSSITWSKIEPILYEIILLDMTSRMTNRLCQIILKLTTHEKTLPQGAPTSPFLFYIFLSKKMEYVHGAIWRQLKKIKASECKISIYVDNIVISTKNKRITPEAISGIIHSIESVGLPINRQKTRLYDCRQGAAIVTGLSIDGKGNIAIPKTKREIIRTMLNNSCYIPYNPKLDEKIDGTISYVRYIYGNEIPNRIKKPYDKYREHRNLQKLALEKDTHGPL